MTKSDAIYIFQNLDEVSEPIEIKAWAIRVVLAMGTHNSITKDQILAALSWTWNQAFEIKEKQE